MISHGISKPSQKKEESQIDWWLKALLVVTMKHAAAYVLCVLGGNASPSADDLKVAARPAEPQRPKSPH